MLSPTGFHPLSFPMDSFSLVLCGIMNFVECLTMKKTPETV